MQNLTLKQTHLVSAAENHSANGSTAYGHYYETPNGEIKFNAIRIVFDDGRQFSFGFIPEGWKLLPGEIVVIHSGNNEA